MNIFETLFIYINQKFEVDHLFAFKMFSVSLFLNYSVMGLKYTKNLGFSI